MTTHRISRPTSRLFVLAIATALPVCGASVAAQQPPATPAPAAPPAQAGSPRHSRSEAPSRCTGPPARLFCSTSSSATRRGSLSATCSRRNQGLRRRRRLASSRPSGWSRGRSAKSASSRPRARRPAARSQPAGEPRDDGVRQGDRQPPAVAAGGARLPRQQHGVERLDRRSGRSISGCTCARSSRRIRIS